MSHLNYENPLISRYASPQMSELFGAQRKFHTWRKLWIALAEAEAELGIDIQPSQIEQLKANAEQIDFDKAASYEKKLRHDVMAHVHTFGDACPDAKGIIHLGATSCFVTDNTDLIILREALQMVANRLATVIVQLGDFAKQHRDLPCLGFTHLQPAQPTTVGKRACLWAYDLALDLLEIEHRIEQLKARSTKGTTGTQASFLKLFDGDHEKVRQLEDLVAKKIGFTSTYQVTGQTYSRKIDSQALDALSGIAQSAHKAASDFRILSHRKELEEPFEKSQIGSSAMAYKRNPMRSERICALSRFVISLAANGANTMATQWMERTLDDSANRRLSLPQAFLAIDAILIIYQNISSAMVVYPKVVEKNLLEELPFMATENILMAAVAAGGDRQELHEKIRVHSNAAGEVVKKEGKPNDLFQRLAKDEAFAAILNSAEQSAEKWLEPSQYTGRASQQVDEFQQEIIAPIKQRYPDAGKNTAELRV